MVVRGGGERGKKGGREKRGENLAEEERRWGEKGEGEKRGN